MAPNPFQHISKDHISLHDPENFNKLYNRTYMIVFRFVYGLYGGPTEDIEDLTSEVFTRAWKNRRKFRGSDSAALGWLIKIARNLVIDTIRMRKSRGQMYDIEQHIVKADQLSPEEHVQLQEQVKILWSLMQGLPHLQREILVLRYMLGWRVKDISNHLEMKENTVSVYIRRAIGIIQKNWHEKNEEI